MIQAVSETYRFTTEKQLGPDQFMSKAHYEECQYDIAENFKNSLNGRIRLQML